MLSTSLGLKKPPIQSQQSCIAIFGSGLQLAAYEAAVVLVSRLDTILSGASTCGISQHSNAQCSGGLLHVPARASWLKGALVRYAAYASEIDLDLVVQ